MISLITLVKLSLLTPQLPGSRALPIRSFPMPFSRANVPPSCFPRNTITKNVFIFRRRWLYQSGRRRIYLISLLVTIELKVIILTFFRATVITLKVFLITLTTALLTINGLNVQLLIRRIVRTLLLLDLLLQLLLLPRQLLLRLI